MVQCVQALSGARGWTGRAQSWANVSPKGGGGHVAHAHAGTLSGVFFVSVVGSQDFCYRPPDAGFFGSPAAACVPVASGDVLVFPSFMLHHVPPFAGERISIAFNLFVAMLHSSSFSFLAFKAASNLFFILALSSLACFCSNFKFSSKFSLAEFADLICSFS